MASPRVGEDAGRDAYLAGIHTAQAVIRVRTGATARTHRGVHRVLAQRDPELAGLAVFLSQAYNLKAFADYELGRGAGVPLDHAHAAIESAGPCCTDGACKRSDANFAWVYTIRT